MAESSDIGFEREVIDRLARIETEQKQIRSDIADFRVLEERITVLEADSNRRKGASLMLNAVIGLAGVLIGALVSIFVGRMFP